jgi:hypothetical protein
MRHTHRTTAQRGNTLIAGLFVVIVCVGLTSAVVLANTAHSNESQSLLERERAFQLAEAGADWGLSQVRALGASIPADWSDNRAIGGVGSFEVSYLPADSNGIDDDSDGVVDEADEAALRLLTSTGISGDTRRRLQVLVQETIEFPEIPGAVVLNVENPIVDLRGNAFTISGHDHRVDGSVDPLRDPTPAILSLALPEILAMQIDPRVADQVFGEGDNPSVGQGGWIDLAQLAEQGSQNASIEIPSGPAQSGLQLGTPTRDGVVTAFCNGDCHLSGGSGGAGILIVDGDLQISGGFEWIGVIIVRGRVHMVGGGSGKRVIGAMLVGEEVTSAVSESEVGVEGTVDLLFSSSGVTLAERAFVSVSVVTWRELGAE